MHLSVVIPLYNKKDSILKTLQTVLMQDLLPHEILVVNDGSTDGSEELVASFKHPLVRLIHQPNSGVSMARNRGIQEAATDWIAFLDADDVWEPTYLSTIQAMQRQFPEAGLLATAYFLEDYKGERTNMILNNLPFEGKIGLLDNYFEVASKSHPPIWSSAVVIHRQALLQIGGFPPGVKSGEDLITWARLAVRFSIAYCSSPMATFIQAAAHTYDDAPNRLPEEVDYVGTHLIALKKQAPQTPYLAAYIAHWFKMRASIYLRLGMKAQAWREIKKSLHQDASNTKVYIYLALLILPVTITRKIFKSLAS